MRFGKLNKFSTADYPGKMCAVVYTAGCDFDCWWCPDPSLTASDGEVVPEEEIMEFLRRRFGMLEAVVISGGEPTLQKDLGEFIRTCRNIGYDVMLRTNGSNPRELSTILSERLLTRVQVNFKAPVEQYERLCAFHGSAVTDTIEILRRARLPFDVRTIVRPDMTPHDLEEMSQQAGEVPSWILRPYRPGAGADPKDIEQSERLLPVMQKTLEETQPSVTVARH